MSDPTRRQVPPVLKSIFIFRTLIPRLCTYQKYEKGSHVLCCFEQIRFHEISRNQQQQRKHPHHQITKLFFSQIIICKMRVLSCPCPLKDIFHAYGCVRNS